MQDAEVREMLAMAGVRVDNDEEVRNFARLIRWMFSQEDAWAKKKANRMKLLGALAVAVATSFLAWFIPVAVPIIGEMWSRHP